MAISLICGGTYADGNGKTKKCGQMEPYMDPKTEKVFCSLCDQEISNVAHFTKTTMKTLRQFKEKKAIPFGVKCQACQKEAKPVIIDDEVSCPACKKPHANMSEPFKIMMKEKLKTGNRDI